MSITINPRNEGQALNYVETIPGNSKKDREQAVARAIYLCRQLSQLLKAGMISVEISFDDMQEEEYVFKNEKVYLLRQNEEIFDAPVDGLQPIQFLVITDISHSQVSEEARHWLFVYGLEYNDQNSKEHIYNVRTVLETMAARQDGAHRCKKSTHEEIKALVKLLDDNNAAYLRLIFE